MSSRKEQKEALRAERLEREQQAAAAERRKQLVGYGAGGVLAVAAVAAIVVVLLSGGGGGGGVGGAEAVAGEFPAGTAPAVQETDLETAAEAASCELVSPPNEGGTHTDSLSQRVTYEASPPTSGDHYIVPAEDGSYTQAPQTEETVHSLEHGRIVIQFAPDAPDSVKGDLKALYDEDPYHMLIAPNTTDMPYEVAATAWDQGLVCEQMNEQVFDAIRAFREEYRDRGPEAVP